MFRLVSKIYMKRVPGAAFTFILFVVLSSVLVQFVSPYADDLRGAVHLESGGQHPSLKHWFGTDAVSYTHLRAHETR